MKRLIALAALVLSPTAAQASPSVATANGDWSYLPALVERDYSHLDLKALQILWDIANSRRCSLPGYRGMSMNFRLSFAVQYKPDGSLDRVILPPMNCPEAEGILGRVLIDMIQGGDYGRVPADSDGWYRGDFTFDYAS